MIFSEGASVGHRERPTGGPLPWTDDRMAWRMIYDNAADGIQPPGDQPTPLPTHEP